MARPITIDVNIYDVTLTVSGDYEPGEDPIMYDSNMEGYPGAPAEFEIETVELEGIEISQIISDEVYEKIIEQVINKQS